MTEHSKPAVPTTPMALEQAIFQQPWYDLIKLPGRSAQASVVRARAALHSGDTPLILKHARVLERFNSISALGLRALLLCELDCLPEVLSLELDDSAIVSPMDEMGASWYYNAQGLAYAKQGRYASALEALGVASFLARRLKLPIRIRALKHEGLRLANLMGLPNPEAIEEALGAPSLSLMHRDWLKGSLYVAARWGTGEYDAALDGAADQPDARYLTAALMGQIAERPDGTPTSVTCAGDAWQQLRRGEHVQLYPDMAVSTTSGLYARLAAGFELARSEQTAQQALLVVGYALPERVDQAVLWVAVTLMAYLHGATPHQELGLFRELTHALTHLRTRAWVLNILQQFAPEVLALSALGPGPHQDVQYLDMTLPRLTGRSVQSQSGTEAVGLPGIKAISAGLNGTRSEDFGAVNLGRVLFGTRRLATAARENSMPMLVKHWERTSGHLFGSLDAEVQEVNSAHFSHCAPTVLPLKLKA